MPVPPVVESVSQEAGSLAVHVRVPPPVLLMARVCVAGLLPPCVAVKERLMGLAPMAGGTGAAVTVKETGTEVTPAPPLRVMVPLWVPTVRAPVATLTVMLPFPVPELGLRINHAVLSLALQFNVPPPVLLRLRVCAAGFAPPWVAAKDRLVGLAPIAGGTGAAATVKETGTVTGVTPVPPLRVTVPL